MNKRLRKTVKIVVAAHVLALLALAAGPRLACRPAPPDTAITVSFRMEAPAKPAPPDPMPSPKPEPLQPPAVPVSPPSSPDPVPPKPKARRKVEVSQQRVVREVEVTPKPVFKDEMVRILEKQLTQSTRLDTVDDSEVYLLRVRDTLYRAWENRPSAQEAGRAAATVTLRFEAGGRVAERTLTRPSGNAALDASVMKAVQSVTWIPGLSESFLKSRNYRVSVAFRLE